jgi:hypothetical protein
MKTYVLTYHWALPSNLPDVLAKAGIDEWLQVWPGMVFFKGAESQSYYAAKINDQRDLRLFIVTEYDPGKSTGWMPPRVWEWIEPALRPLPSVDELVKSRPGAQTQHI